MTRQQNAILREVDRNQFESDFDLFRWQCEVNSLINELLYEPKAKECTQ